MDFCFGVICDADRDLKEGAFSDLCDADKDLKEGAFSDLCDADRDLEEGAFSDIFNVSNNPVDSNGAFPPSCLIFLVFNFLINDLSVFFNFILDNFFVIYFCYYIYNNNKNIQINLY